MLRPFARSLQCYAPHNKYKRIQQFCAALRRSRNKRNVASCWFQILSNFKLRAATRNNMQQGVQTEGTRWEIDVDQQCCVRLHGAFSVTLPIISTRLFFSSIVSLYQEYEIKRVHHPRVRFTQIQRQKNIYF